MYLFLGAVGAFQFQFVFDGGAARDLHVHVLEDAVPGRPRAENWVSLSSMASVITITYFNGLFVNICFPLIALNFTISAFVYVNGYCFDRNMFDKSPE